MKIKILFQFTLMITLLTSCTSPNYFQVYKTVPVDNTNLKGDYLVYEDENCKVFYNFWTDNGDIGFLFSNKTDQTIKLNLEQSYFIFNGIAQSYYQNRTYTNTKNSGITSVNTIGASKMYTGINYFDLLQTNKILATSSSGATSSEEYSVTYAEEKVVSIPSNASKIITEFSITNSFFRDCELLKYPTKNEIKTKSFTKSTSPIVFSNRIVYWKELDQLPINFVNEFFVSEITNYAENDITERKYEEFCDQKSSVSKLFFKEVSPDKFYLKYTKGMDYWKH